MLKHGKTNTVVTFILLVMAYFLNLIDYVQTIYGIQKFGLSIELNPLMRFCFEHDIALQVKLIMPLLILLIIGLITLKVEPRYICTAWCMFILHLLVVLHNHCQLEAVVYL